MDTLRCLAIDMGASSIRVLLGEISDNHIKYKEIYRFKNEIKLVNGSDKWDIEGIYTSLLEGINKALIDYPDIASLGVDSWGVDYVLIDRQGKLVEMPYAYRDSRTEGMMDKWKKRMSDEETFQRTGINFYVFNTLFQLISSQNSREIKKAHSLLFIPAYIYYRLSGKKINEVTISSTSQLLELNSNNFDKEILKKLDINPSFFGKTINPGNIVGKVNEAELVENKIQAVSVCSHDTASAVAAIPTNINDFIFISTGTWCIIGIESKNPILTKEALELGFTNERGYGNTYRILKNIVGLWLVQGIQKAMPESKDFSEMEKMAMESEPSDHIVNPEDEMFYNPDNMLEAFDHYFEKTGQSKPESIGQYIRCAYNSLSLVFNYYVNKLEALTNNSYETVHLIGGGSQSVHLCQSTANYTLKQVYSGPVECATIGNIMVQAIAMKKIKNIEEGRSIIKKSFPQKAFKPLLKENESKEMYQKFLKLKKL
ncbi:MAG: rhamnulokinase family protein [Bacteroidota bacterium]